MVPVIVWYAVPAVFVLYGIRKYRESKWGKCKNHVQLNGKVIVITGANSGIGYETAKELARRGAIVVIACRNEKRAYAAITSIVKQLDSKAKLDFIELDLASLQSVRDCAALIKSKYNNIDILINNAGVSYPSNEKHLTKDKFEIHFGVNYLGHFLLTNLLTDLLKKSENPRVINVSSLLHQRGTLNLDDVNYEHTKPKNAYADSKLAMMYFGRELAQRVKNDGIKVYSLCPGWVCTNLFRHSLKNVFRLLFALPVAFFFMRTRVQGAQTSIYCATDLALDKETGLFYRECRRFTSTHNFDDEKGKQLWELSEKLVLK